VNNSNYKTNPDPENLGPIKKRALIVDDETDICYLLGHIQTTFAGSLEEADTMLQSADPFYFVFLDNHLPDGLGINQIKRWKEKFPFVHFIVITAHDSNEERRKAKSDGADSFIGKPFSRDIILKAIGEA